MAELIEGAVAPLFDAQSVDGRPVSLEGFLGRCHLLLVFLWGARRRSCQRHVRSLARSYPLFLEKGAAIVAVSSEPARALERWLQASVLPFPVVVDPEREIAETYGQRRSWWRVGELPAQFLICKRGIVRFVEYGRNPWDVTPPNWFLLAIGKLDAALNAQTQ